MGSSCCKSNKIDPTIEPIPVKDRKPVVTHEPTQQPISDSNKSTGKHKIKHRTSIDEEIQSDDDNHQLINSLINQQNNITIDALARDNDLVDIAVADPHAFNNSIVQQRQQAIDNQSYRLHIKSWRPNSLEQLVNTIKDFSKNKSLIECHWIIFYWIACNIEYDTVSYFSKNYADQSAEGVFRTKKGVCAGYANIYKYLCDQLNIPCEEISGYAKGYGFDDREDAPTETDHAWNAVEINHHWYLMESTWGAGHLNDQKAFKRELDSYYFLPRPNEMIYHHLPEDENWQLLRQPIKMNQYMQMPKLHPNYFELNLELISPRNQVNVDLLPDKSYALVLIRAPSDIDLSAALKLHDKKIEGGHRIIFDNKKQLYCCYFAPNAIGKHKVTIFGKRGDTETGTYNGAIDLNLNVKQTPKHPISFPTTWKNYFDLGLKIVSPKNTHLIKLRNGTRFAEILIQTPADVHLLGELVNSSEEKVEGGHEIFYDRREDLWRCKFAPNYDGIFKAQIFAQKKSDEGSYKPAVEVKIDAKQIPEHPISFPKTWENYFDLGLKIVSPKNTHLIKLCNGTRFAEILIQTPADVHLLGELVNSSEEKVEGGHEIFYDRREDLWRCKFAPNYDGIFKAQIFAQKKSDEGSYKPAVEVKIDAKQIPTPSLSYPYTWQDFYDLDLKIEAPRDRHTAVWPENASFTEVRMSAPDDVQLSCGIEYNGVKEKNCTLAQFDNDKQQWQLLFAPQHTGQHKLIIYAKRQSDANLTSNAVASLDLNVTKLRNTIKFPITYSKFQDDKCRLYEPLHGTLKKGAIVPIHCVIPGATEVDLQVDSEWINTEGYKDPILKTEVKVGSKDVAIYAKYGQNKSYDGLVKYSVQ